MSNNANNPVTRSSADATLDAGIAGALEQAPEVAIPADFAARVRASLPTRPLARPRPSAARIAATGAAAASLVALCWLAPHAPPSFQSLAFDMELALLAELAVIAGWLATARGTM